MYGDSREITEPLPRLYVRRMNSTKQVNFFLLFQNYELLCILIVCSMWIKRHLVFREQATTALSCHWNLQENSKKKIRESRRQALSDASTPTQIGTSTGAFCNDIDRCLFWPRLYTIMFPLCYKYRSSYLPTAGKLLPLDICPIIALIS